MNAASLIHGRPIVDGYNDHVFFQMGSRILLADVFKGVIHPRLFSYRHIYAICIGYNALHSVKVKMDSDKKVGANFKLRSQYKLIARVAQVGCGTVNPVPPLEGRAYTEGKVVFATATPTEGDMFDEWSGDAFGTEKSVPV